MYIICILYASAVYWSVCVCSCWAKFWDDCFGCISIEIMASANCVYSPNKAISCNLISRGSLVINHRMEWAILFSDSPVRQHSKNRKVYVHSVSRLFVWLYKYSWVATILLYGRIIERKQYLRVIVLFADSDGESCILYTDTRTNVQVAHWNYVPFNSTKINSISLKASKNHTTYIST